MAVQNSETVESPHQNTTLSPRYRKLIEEHDFSKNSCGALEVDARQKILRELRLQKYI